MEIPVYLFMGFLESGKTTFGMETLVDREFTEGQKTLLLVTEEGEVEYDESKLNDMNIWVEYLDEDSFNSDHLIDLQRKYRPKRVMIEYNGTWKLEKLFSMKVPKGWTVVQVISFVNAQTFDLYFNNMRQMMMEHLTDADMIVFNRCDENTKKADYRKIVKSVNRRGQIIFENMEGMAEVDDGQIELPFDVEKDFIEIEDDDYGLFYIDAADHVEKYEGKTVKFKAEFFHPKGYNQESFVPGRFAMTCCVDDIAFVGFKCYSNQAKYFNDRQWVMVTAKVGKEYYEDFGGYGPVFFAESVEKAEPAKEEVVYFT